jgi:hypothetical protein
MHIFLKEETLSSLQVAQPLVQQGMQLLTLAINIARWSHQMSSRKL